ncbi:tRNA (adenosine(37)-N6)-dimethylallyltransferase MiaA [bacterium]|nr:MAG: tRNA (adenosine(37)-N6)-dimethylallyltransferase MiaA [bacterium]
MKTESNPNNQPLMCIVGPTASGKSALAVELALQLGGEIISCDSMQIYRDCDIVTAKATHAERELVPHHLLDIVEPNESFSAASWARMANEVIEEIEARGKMPIVCGGTGFYLRALLAPHTLAVAPPNEQLRAELQAQWEREGKEVMHAKLAEVDAAAAARLHPNDTHRVLRALEVALSPSVAVPFDLPTRNAKVWGLSWTRELLVGRIDERVEAMIDAGALDETRTLVGQFGDEVPALGSVGYKQLCAHMRGELNWAEAVEAWKIATRQYSKRQMTWFRGQTEAVWLDATLGIEKLVGSVIGAEA